MRFSFLLPRKLLKILIAVCFTANNLFLLYPFSRLWFQWLIICYNLIKGTTVSIHPVSYARLVKLIKVTYFREKRKRPVLYHHQMYHYHFNPRDDGIFFFTHYFVLKKLMVGLRVSSANLGLLSKQQNCKICHNGGYSSILIPPGVISRKNKLLSIFISDVVLDKWDLGIFQQLPVSIFNSQWEK